VYQKFLNQGYHNHWIHHLSAVDQHLHCCHHHSLVQQALMPCHWKRMRVVSADGDGDGGGGDGGGDSVDEGGVDSHTGCLNCLLLAGRK
jgi:hypothetical protein